MSTCTLVLDDITVEHVPLNVSSTTVLIYNKDFLETPSVTYVACGVTFADKKAAE